MNKPILLLQFRLPPTDTHEVQCLVRAMNISPDDVEVRNIILNPELVPIVEDAEQYKAVIWGASSDFNVTDWPDAVRESVESLKPFLKACVNLEIPTLGICFGHQVLAMLLGGEVKRDSSQAEGGIVDMYLTEKGLLSPLFAGLPRRTAIAAGHKDSVTKIPKGAVVLASSEKTKVEAFQVGNTLFGIQTHPELDEEALAWRMSLFPEYTMDRSLEDIMKMARPMPDAPQILLNFKRIFGNI